MLEVFLFVVTVILVVLFWPVFLGLVVIGALAVFVILYPETAWKIAVAVVVFGGIGAVLRALGAWFFDEYLPSRRADALRRREQPAAPPDPFG